MEKTSEKSRKPLLRFRFPTSMPVWSWGYERGPSSPLLATTAGADPAKDVVDAAGMKGDVGTSKSKINHRSWRRRKQPAVPSYAKPCGAGLSLKTKRKARSQVQKAALTNIPDATRLFDDVVPADLLPGCLDAPEADAGTVISVRTLAASQIRAKTEFWCTSILQSYHLPPEHRAHVMMTVTYVHQVCNLTLIHASMADDEKYHADELRLAMTKLGGYRRVQARRMPR